MKKPILVIQMQRMGDLILSFPLFLWLERTYPGHPIWVMAEPQFAQPLARISPAVRFLGYGESAAVLGESFHLVINLSHRRESMDLTGQLRCDGLVGGYVRDGVSRVAGNWQEYRMSLTHNNRHNRFHWADLNALDVVPAPVIAKTRWPEPRSMPSAVRKVGLFLGASEQDKRPSAAFWAGLVGELERRGWIPILLGGPGEKNLSQEVLGIVGRPVASACGTLGLEHFAHFGQNLAALVTPDTGPMHLAAWTGLRVLNLSMGPVHAWETGPYQPGHVVLRSARDCVGCWRCRFERPRCHDPFVPVRVAGVLETMIRGGDLLKGLRLPELEILGTGRAEGVYDLVPFFIRFRTGELLGAYWQGFWKQAFGIGPDQGCRQAAFRLRSESDRFVRFMIREAVRFLRSLSQESEQACQGWAEYSPSIRPLTGYASVHLLNNDCSSASRKRVLALAEAHLGFVAGS